MSATRKDWANLVKGVQDGIIHKGYVVYFGERSYPVDDKISVVGAESFLKHRGRVVEAL